MSNSKLFQVGLPILICAMAGQASVVTAITPAGSATSGPVSATATFTTGTNFLNITLTNLEVNPTDVSQLLSNLEFTLSNGATSGTLFSSSGTLITVNTGGTVSFNGSGSTGWGLNNNVAGGLQLDAIGFIGPKGLIIGPPNASGIYSNANGSIDGNSAHNPFVYTPSTLHPATFIITFDPSAGVTAATTIKSATFSFGTTAGQDMVQGCFTTDANCGSSSVPEPISLLLSGTGLLGLFFLRRRFVARS